MQDNQVRQIEIDINTAKVRIKLAEALERLHNNQDFIDLIVNGYFKEEASRAVMFKGDPSMASDAKQKEMDNIITGIGALRQYFHSTYNLGQMSAKAMDEYETTREELHKEALAAEGSLVQ